MPDRATTRPRSDDEEPGIERLRAICLVLPEAVETETWGDPTYRVREKIFAMEKRGDGRVSLWCKAPPGSQTILVGADPERFFVPPYVGHRGWVGMRLVPEPDWTEVAVLVARSYRMTAPKRLAARVAAPGDDGTGRGGNSPDCVEKVGAKPLR